MNSGTVCHLNTLYVDIKLYRNSGGFASRGDLNTLYVDIKLS